MNSELWIYFPDIKHDNFKMCLKRVLSGGFGTLQLPFTQIRSNDQFNYFSEALLNMSNNDNHSIKLAISVR